ncbi:hypothetical protein CH270_02135 [Rhodococcus sp. 02-925g]|nr:hypothetical protein CH270_02135 [Rhodococcus sp. 02-925g]
MVARFTVATTFPEVRRVSVVGERTWGWTRASATVEARTTSDATDSAATTALIHSTGISRCRTTISMTVTTPNIAGMARVPRTAVNVAESASTGACRPRAHSSSACHRPT